MHLRSAKTGPLNFCEINGDIINFNGEMWRFFCKFTAYSIGEITKIHRLKSFKKIYGYSLFILKVSMRRLTNVSPFLWTKFFFEAFSKR